MQDNKKHIVQVCFVLLCVISIFLGNVFGALNPIEQTYLGLPNRTNTREYLQNYTAVPHLAGSPEDYQTVLYTRDKFLEFGLDVEITYHPVYMNTPLHRVVQLVTASGDVVFSANMTEPDVPVDPTSNSTLSVPTYNGYSASGNVTARLVYANYGTLDDFQYLESNGISVNGSIVIVRYGRVFRGVKAYLAQKFGAVGCLIYSDPADDGYVRAGGVNNTYPEGPWRPEFGVQRGSIEFLPICPGSPSQERVAVCLGEEHAEDDFVGALIPSIPVQPLSWGDAYPLLVALNGTHPVPPTFQGGLNFTYNTGPSSLLVHLALVQNYTTLPIWNVVATLPGLRHDEIVIMGNHRDAWVFGATDPSSGSSTMLETARALSELRNKTGWVPQRDIVFCSWDGEEIGLLGSTAWGEENAEYLQKTVIAYVNVDVGVSGGRFEVGGTPTFLQLMLELAGDLPYPANPSTTLLQNWNVSQLDVLGSGSDYTVFIDNLGIPSIDISYEGPRAGVYHSVYDSFYWMEHFGDPEFIFHEGLAQLLGILLMRISDSTTHPFNYTNYGAQLQYYLTQIKPISPPQADFTVLENAISQFLQAGITIDAQSHCVASNSCVEAVDLEALNARLRYTERRMLLNALTNSSDGLPVRPWYKHVVQAPGFYEGYGSQVFPGIDQGILDNDPVEVQYQIERAATTISNAAQALTELTVTATATPNKCFGDSLGVLTLTSQGGFTPVRYSVNIVDSVNANASTQLSPVFANLESALYVVHVIDALNITSNFTVNVTQPAKLEVTVTRKEKEASVDVKGGVPVYTIVWSSGHNSTSIELNDYGKYNVTVTDSNGCSATATFSYDNSRKLGPGAIAGICVIAGIIVVGTGAIIFYYLKNRSKEKYSML